MLGVCCGLVGGWVCGDGGGAGGWCGGFHYSPVSGCGELARALRRLPRPSGTLWGPGKACRNSMREKALYVLKSLFA